MNTDELRTVLHERAGLADPTGPAARVEAVHGRVQVVRRRRRQVVASAVGVVVVAAGASVVPTLWRPTPSPADQKAHVVLAGRPVPTAQTAAGFGYHYVEGVQSRPGAAKLQLTVPGGPAPKLVMWATSSTNPAPVVRLRSNIGPAIYRSAAGGFERYVLVNEKTRLTLIQRHAPARNRLALAVYDLDHAPPPGVSNGVVTFRQNILGDQLVSGLIGKPGQADLRTTIRAVHGPIRVSDLCYGAGDQDYLHVAFNGEDIGGAQCSSPPYFDPGVDGASFTAAQSPLPARGPIHVHVWLTGKNGSAASATSHAVIGFGLYRLSRATFTLAGQRVPVRQEYDGHEYVVMRRSESRPGDRQLIIHVPSSDVPRLVTFADSGYGSSNALTELLVGPNVRSAFEDGTSGGATVASGYVIQPGESPTLTLRARTKAPGHVVLGLAVSDQVH